MDQLDKHFNYMDTLDDKIEEIEEIGVKLNQCCELDNNKTFDRGITKCKICLNTISNISACSTYCRMKININVRTRIVGTISSQTRSS